LRHAARHRLDDRAVRKVHRFAECPGRQELANLRDQGRELRRELDVLRDALGVERDDLLCGLRLGDRVVALHELLKRDDVDAFVIELLGRVVSFLARKNWALHGCGVEAGDLFRECLLACEDRTGDGHGDVAVELLGIDRDRRDDQRLFEVERVERDLLVLLKLALPAYTGVISTCYPTDRCTEFLIGLCNSLDRPGRSKRVIAMPRDAAKGVARAEASGSVAKRAVSPEAGSAQAAGRALVAHASPRPCIGLTGSAGRPCVSVTVREAVLREGCHSALTA
jgi:hypothetical protein